MTFGSLASPGVQNGIKSLYANEKPYLIIALSFSQNCVWFFLYKLRLLMGFGNPCKCPRSWKFFF